MKKSAVSDTTKEHSPPHAPKERCENSERGHTIFTCSNPCAGLSVCELQRWYLLDELYFLSLFSDHRQ